MIEYHDKTPRNSVTRVDSVTVIIFCKHKALSFTSSRCRWKALSLSLLWSTLPNKLQQTWPWEEVPGQTRESSPSASSPRQSQCSAQCGLQIMVNWSTGQLVKGSTGQLENCSTGQPPNLTTAANTDRHEDSNLISHPWFLEQMPIKTFTN